MRRFATPKDTINAIRLKFKKNNKVQHNAHENTLFKNPFNNQLTKLS